MPSKKLRIGIIGAGGFAADHMEAFSHIPEARGRRVHATV